MVHLHALRCTAKMNGRQPFKATCAGVASARDGSTVLADVSGSEGADVAGGAISFNFVSAGVAMGPSTMKPSRSAYRSSANAAARSIEVIRGLRLDETNWGLAIANMPASSIGAANARSTRAFEAACGAEALLAETADNTALPNRPKPHAVMINPATASRLGSRLSPCPHLLSSNAPCVGPR